MAIDRITISLVCDNVIRTYNKQWFGIDETTDVISFPMNTPIPDPDNNQTLVGELLINHQEVHRNAEKYGVSFEQEMARVVAHGVLHLYGYTDDTEKGRATMKAIEDTIVEEITEKG